MRVAQDMKTQMERKNERNQRRGKEIDKDELIRKQKDAIPKSSPLNSADEQFTYSTNTMHANSSSMESEEEVSPIIQPLGQQSVPMENIQDNSDFQVSPSYPTPAQRENLEDGKRMEGDDSLDTLDLHQPLSSHEWSEEVENTK